MKELRSWPYETRRVCETDDLGPARNMLNRFVLLESGSEDKARLWVAKVILVFRMGMTRNGKEGELAFVQPMVCSPSHDNVDKVMGCGSLQKVTDDATDQTIAGKSGISGEYSLG